MVVTIAIASTLYILCFNTFPLKVVILLNYSFLYIANDKHRGVVSNITAA